MSSGTNLILHITTDSAWRKALDDGFDYRTESLQLEGFIHCSTMDQVNATAQRYFAGRFDLIVLVIDEAKVVAPIKYEGVPGGSRFPHIYGTLNLDAIVRVVDIPPQADGSFKFIVI